jgi:20S proteasome alpha/beta subunit
MTLIFGARCTNGVVIVSDRMVKTGEKTSYSIDKIRRCGDYAFAVFGAAGLGTLYEEFLTILPQIVERNNSWVNYQNEKLKRNRDVEFSNDPKAPEPPLFHYTVEDFKHDCVELLTDMKKRYSVAFENDEDCVLQILIGVNTGTEAKLYYLDSINCLPAEVPECVFIGYGECVEVFRKIWNPSMDILSAAELGAFTIKYVEYDEITKNVGVGKGNQPQIWIIPDGYHPDEMDFEDEQTKKMITIVDAEVEAVYTKLHSLFRS